MSRSRVRTLALLLSLSPLHLSARAQEARPLSEAELQPVVAAARAWLETSGAGDDRAAALAGLQGALQAARKAAGGGDPLRWSGDLGRALKLARAPARPTERPGSVVELETREGAFARTPLGWAVRLPREYDPGAGPYPLILSLPDEGETPAEHIRTQWGEAALRDGAIVVAPRMPPAQAEWTRVSVHGRPGGLCHALTALRLAEERFAVDPERIFVVGRGKAVPAALAAGDAFPQRFAGVVGRAGDAGETLPDNLLAVPVLLVGGGARATALAEAARAAAVETIELRSQAGELELWSWMKEHPRRNWPESVHVVPGDPFPTRAHWLRIAPTAPDAQVHARIEPDVNGFAITGSGFSRATLYLSDDLLDLDRPLRVTCNGVQREYEVRRSLSTALDLWSEGISDADTLYVAEIVFDVAPPADAAALAAGPDPEFEGRLSAAGADPWLLWELARWCWDNARVPAGTRTLEKLLRIDPEHAEARRALGHARGFERWFPSELALQRFAAGQDEAVARSRGYVKHKSLWVHPADRVALGKGLIKDTFTGQWLGLDDTKRLASGWVRQDLEWIAPADAQRVDLGEWRVDGEWLAAADAERRHANVARMWSIPGPEILLHTTVERRVALLAASHMQRALDDLRKVFGVEPALPLEVTLLRDEEQYDQFAFGAPDGRRRPTHVARLHSVHTAYFAESWFETVAGKPVFRGMGVGYWDTHVPDGDAYGVHSARLATGLSFVEAVDPSPKAVRKVARAEPTAEYLDAWRAEKRLPQWLRWGGAVYAERYFEDTTVGEGGERWWARKWSLANLRERGGLRELDPVFAFELDPERRDDALRLLIEAGLLVSFAVDGGCAPVSEAHAALRTALADGASPNKAVAALEQALRAEEGALRAFAAAE